MAGSGPVSFLVGSQKYQVLGVFSHLFTLTSGQVQCVNQESEIIRSAQAPIHCIESSSTLVAPGLVAGIPEADRGRLAESTRVSCELQAFAVAKHIYHFGGILYDKNCQLVLWAIASARFDNQSPEEQVMRLDSRFTRPTIPSNHGFSSGPLCHREEFDCSEVELLSPKASVRSWIHEARVSRRGLSNLNA